MDAQAPIPAIFNRMRLRRADAVAYITGSSEAPNIRGRVMFFVTDDGIMVTADVKGLPGGNAACDNPIFAMHIHTGAHCSGDSDDPFAHANGHYNPDGCAHPDHAGDLPPLFSNDGSAWYSVLTDRFNLREILGRTVIIHSDPDDFTTQPSGNSGKRIACGVIQKI